MSNTISTKTLCPNCKIQAEKAKRKPTTTLVEYVIKTADMKKKEIRQRCGVCGYKP